MTGYPSEPTHDEQLRDAQDQIRRLWTRIPPGMPIIEFTGITDADLYNRTGPFEGWTINDPITFSRQGNTAHVWGSVQWTGASAGYPYLRTEILRPGVLPAEFMPNVNHRDLMTSGGVSAPEELWSMVLQSNGIIRVFGFHATASPPWGTLADPVTPIVDLEFTYPLVI